MNPEMQYVAVVPAFNEEKRIREIVSGVLEQVDSVVVVNDGSTDSTAACLDGLDIRLYNNTRNMGKGASLQRGFVLALELNPWAIITLDGDGQHRPEDIPRVLDAFNASPDRIIIGARTKNRSAAPLMRRFANRFADFWISWACGYRIRDTQSGFRLYPAGLLRQVAMSSDSLNTFVFESEILIKASGLGYYARSIDVETISSGGSGQSNYRPVTDTWKIVQMVAMSLFRRFMYPVGLLRILGLLPSPVREGDRGRGRKNSGKNDVSGMTARIDKKE